MKDIPYRSLREISTDERCQVLPLYETVRGKRPAFSFSALMPDQSTPRNRRPFRADVGQRWHGPDVSSEGVGSRVPPLKGNYCCPRLLPMTALISPSLRLIVSTRPTVARYWPFGRCRRGCRYFPVVAFDEYVSCPFVWFLLRFLFGSWSFIFGVETASFVLCYGGQNDDDDLDMGGGGGGGGGNDIKNILMTMASLWNMTGNKGRWGIG